MRQITICIPDGGVNMPYVDSEEPARQGVSNIELIGTLKAVLMQIEASSLLTMVAKMMDDGENKQVADLEAQLDRSMRTAELHTEASRAAHTRYFELSSKYTELVNRICQLEDALEDIAAYATIETPAEVTEIINGVLNKGEK